MTTEPKRFEVHEPGALLHGTKADLAVGDLLVPGRLSNFEEGRIMNHIYVTQTLDAATWEPSWRSAKLVAGSTSLRRWVRSRTIPNVTDKKFPGNPTLFYRMREPVRIVGELPDWTGHSSVPLKVMRDRLADLKHQGIAVIYD